jgi:hypothetical protein
MNEQAVWLDGNALGGLLQELFGTELTDAPHGCGSCGAVRAIGAHRLYRGAGLVLRCPVCSDIALVVATSPNRHVVHLAGAWRMEMSRA